MTYMVQEAYPGELQDLRAICKGAIAQRRLAIVECLARSGFVSDTAMAEKISSWVEGADVVARSNNKKSGPKKKAAAPFDPPYKKAKKKGKRKYTKKSTYWSKK